MEIFAQGTLGGLEKSLRECVKIKLDLEIDYTKEANKEYYFEKILEDLKEHLKENKEKFKVEFLSQIFDYEKLKKDKDSFPTCFVINRLMWANETLMMLEYQQKEEPKHQL